MTEISRTFTCFGGATTVAIDGPEPGPEIEEALQGCIDLLLDLHAAYSRFKPESELSRLNEDPREEVEISAEMVALLRAGIEAAQTSGGLVDFTLLDAIETAGYREDRFQGTMALPLVLALAPPREPAGGSPGERWRQIKVDAAARRVTRPVGVKVDGGGIVKGLAADRVADRLAGFAGFAVDCEGDMRVGGASQADRVLEVPNPFGGPVVHEFNVRSAALATTSIAKRSWLQSMRPTHHVLDPRSERPAFTGVVQASALAPTALEGETLAKAAVLAGPGEAPGWLRHGGVIVFDDGSHQVVEP